MCQSEATFLHAGCSVSELALFDPTMRVGKVQRGHHHHHLIQM
jgi:hypothetical protein